MKRPVRMPALASSSGELTYGVAAISLLSRDYRGALTIGRVKRLSPSGLLAGHQVIFDKIRACIVSRNTSPSSNRCSRSRGGRFKTSSSSREACYRARRPLAHREATTTEASAIDLMTKYARFIKRHPRPSPHLRSGEKLPNRGGLARLCGRPRASMCIKRWGGGDVGL